MFSDVNIWTDVGRATAALLRGLPELLKLALIRPRYRERPLHAPLDPRHSRARARPARHGHLARRPSERAAGLPARPARRRRRRAGLRRGRRHHQPRLLPQGQPRPAARQVARRRRQVARRPVLQLLLAEGLRGLPGGHAGPVLRRRHDRRGDRRGPARDDGLRRLARRQGRPEARRRRRRGQRPLDRRLLVGGLDRPHQGPGRDVGDADREVRQARARGQARARAGGHPGRGVLDGARGLAQGRPRAPRRLHLGRARRGLPGGPQAAARRAPTGIVLDLRDNGGGLLNEAVLVSSIFIPEGRIVSTKGRSRPERVYEATGGAIPAKVPVAVLVNRQSASASEIVTGALQDRKRADGRRHAHVRQGRLPGDRAAVQRRRAGHHRRRVLPAQRAQHRRRRRRQGRRHRARRQGGRRSRRPSRTRRSTRPSASSCATAREAPAGRPARTSAARRPGRRGARAARPLPDRRAVLPPRAAHERRAPATGLGRAARRSRARRARTGRGRATRRSCAGSGARTSPAT